MFIVANSCLIASHICALQRMVNPLMGTLKLQSNEPLYKIWRLVHWPLMGGLLHLVQQGGDWAGQSPPCCTKCPK